jgi:hypothetical protein
VKVFVILILRHQRLALHRQLIEQELVPYLKIIEDGTPSTHINVEMLTGIVNMLYEVFLSLCGAILDFTVNVTSLVQFITYQNICPLGIG